MIIITFLVEKMIQQKSKPNFAHIRDSLSTAKNKIYNICYIKYKCSFVKKEKLQMWLSSMKYAPMVAKRRFYTSKSTPDMVWSRYPLHQAPTTIHHTHNYELCRHLSIPHLQDQIWIVSQKKDNHIHYKISKLNVY